MTAARPCDAAHGDPEEATVVARLPSGGTVELCLRHAYKHWMALCAQGAVMTYTSLAAGEAAVEASGQAPRAA